MTLDSAIATAHRTLSGPVTDILLRVGLAYRTSTNDDWALAAMSDSLRVSASLASGASARIAAARLAIPRPPYQLAMFWLVFRFEAIARTPDGKRAPFATYAHSDPAIFKKFM